MTTASTMPDQVGKSCLATNYMHTSSGLDPTVLDIYSSFPEANSRTRSKKLLQQHKMEMRREQFIETLKNHPEDEPSAMGDAPEPVLLTTAVNNRGSQQS